MTDKVIVSNRSALHTKYGSRFSAVEAGIKALIAADARKGLATVCVYVDDPVEMAKYGGVPPVNAADQHGNKAAVDAIQDALAADYLVLLDGPDVMPHIALDNPLPSDGDSAVDSDLPYATSDKFSTDIVHNLKVTRVVGRIPNSPGDSDPKGLLTLLKNAENAALQSPSVYQSYRGLTAAVWRDSTRMSLNSVFGNDANLLTAPPDIPPGTDRWFANASHFINCHGASLSPEFYGQSGGAYPVAMSSQQVSRRAKAGTIVAAECCYGAQLYDPNLANIDAPICMAYLLKGALGFLGSTNIAYGPADSNGQADLMCQFFLKEVLRGASQGRALLQARQRFIITQKLTDPSNLKTLAQFILLGDPSVTPCASGAVLAGTTTYSIDTKAQIKAARAELAAAGMTLPESKAVPAGPGEISPKVRDRVRGIARERGFAAEKDAVLAVSGPANYRAAAKERAVSERVMIVSEGSDTPHGRPKGVVGFRHLVAHIVGEGISSIEVIESR